MTIPLPELDQFRQHFTRKSSEEFATEKDWSLNGKSSMIIQIYYKSYVDEETLYIFLPILIA